MGVGCGVCRERGGRGWGWDGEWEVRRNEWENDDDDGGLIFFEFRVLTRRIRFFLRREGKEEYCNENENEKTSDDQMMITYLIKK